MAEPIEVFFLDITPNPQKCPSCRLGMWVSVSALVRLEPRVWQAKSRCYSCGKEVIWNLDPDKPTEHQKKKLIKTENI